MPQCARTNVITLIKDFIWENKDIAEKVECLKRTCSSCKYAEVDASDFPCCECWIDETGDPIRFLPKDSEYDWQIVKVKIT